MQDEKGGPVHREPVLHEILQALALRERPLQQIYTSLGGIVSLPGSAVLSSYPIYRCIKRGWSLGCKNGFLLTRSLALSGQWTLLPSASDGFFNH